LSRRGPIEARARRCTRALTRPRFHGYPAVAPLKPVTDVKVSLGDLLFPRLSRRGPIEATRGSRCPQTPYSLFPRLSRRGPIEASIRARSGIQPDLVSTAIPPWPH